MYEELSKELTLKMESEKRDGTFRRVAFDDGLAVRRIANPHDDGTVWRTAFIRDIDKIMNCPYYNRYADKTQVFSFYKNDDITRRGLHVQLVSRIARTIGGALNLNLDLIEAIALGHDIGHTPFGHAGEQLLDELYCEKTGRHFSHNIHSVRVLDGIYPYNI
ncbi:MAG: HD domain-containing protein, partial [Clostridia bacterium]|nr:HD domain-containing protein [Clostridia bacterium]